MLLTMKCRRSCLSRIKISMKFYPTEVKFDWPIAIKNNIFIRFKNMNMTWAKIRLRSNSVADVYPSTELNLKWISTSVCCYNLKIIRYFSEIIKTTLSFSYTCLLGNVIMMYEENDRGENRHWHKQISLDLHYINTKPYKLSKIVLKCIR